MPQLSFPANIRSSEDVFLMYATELKVQRRGTGVFTNKTIDTASAIALPTPSEGLVLNESGNWEEAKGFQLSFNKSDAKAAAAMIAFEKGTEAGGPVASFYQKKNGLVNDYASLAYDGSNFRTYTFAWDLIPSSETEARSLANIIKNIRSNSLPSYTGAIIDYPKMWKVLPAGSSLGFYLQDCVISNFTVNYTPDGVLRRYHSGHPVSVNMSIEFRELYRASREDV
jgi:hypothetical protein